ncbi:ABC transporter permease [Catellatospora bangladeshensis]|uniref:Transport permease protein n=1 Tax=Catellatospora bangladeshensis TaxID=310355 RepID=A0A8J3JCB2_9ACTN|nr:ABC transporter permease [Catellatospora bangladeshensis]GIF80024.1 transport permease protein [Catellatospora bangladeshensis]
MKFLRDTWLVFQRQMQLLLRNPVWVIVGIIQPMFFLLLFAPLMKQALNVDGTMTDARAYQIFVPGMLVMVALFSAFSGFGIIAELRAGVIERNRVTPVSRVALLLGRSLRDVVQLLFQAVLVTLLAVPFGLRVGVGDALLAFLLVGLMTLLLSSTGYALGLTLRSEDAMAPVLNTVTQPIMLLAGIFLPLTFAPQWLKNVADFNPFKWTTDGVRALFAGNPGDDAVWQALAILTPLTVLALYLSSRVFAKSVR